jgi:type I restriction-modification system DNA methylase subunit
MKKLTKQQAKEEVKKLVEKYKNLTQDEIKHYNEANTRKNFILPLFEALGWDVNGEEVAEEEKASGKRVDYAFKIGGVTKFFLEAKPLSADLDVQKWADQAIWYAWHKSVPWAILTDFESIKVFNAEWDEQDVERNLAFEIRYQDYLTNDKLRLLSRQAIESGELDRYAEKEFKRPVRIPVDKQLVADLLRWRDKLFNDFKGYNSLINEGKISENVQRVLNRLIFIRTCEDRGFEEKKLQEMVRNWEDARHKNDKLVNNLRKLFLYYDKYYDSKLFEERIIFESDKFVVDDNTLAKVIEETYKNPNKVRWNFDDINQDVLGNIYEQYLGQIQREEKKKRDTNGKNKRKSQGIYYTPRYIVNYIVNQTLGEVLKEKNPEEIKDIKILDPACGSGSFLIRAYEELINYRKVQLDKESKFKKDSHLGMIEKTIKQKRGQKSLSAEAKMNILRSNIYGVDLDEEAVEIAQLNLLLKTVDRRVKLPNLQHILCGNSLISGEEKELKKYFGRNWQDKKPFNWQEKFPEVFERDGFDVVIGNPPYIDSETMMKSDINLRDFFTGKYLSAKGNWDIFCVFIEKALQLLKDGGYFAMIVPNKLLNADYAKSIRDILKNFEIISIRDYSKNPVFEASVYPIVIVVKKKTALKNHNIRCEIVSADYNKPSSIKNIKQGTLADNWISLFGQEMKSFEKIFKKAKQLGDLCDVHEAATVSEAYEIKEVIKEFSGEGDFLKFINTGTIHRYVSLWGIKKTNYIKNQYQKPIILKDDLRENFPKRYKDSLSDKIIIAGMVKRMECLLDEKGDYLAGKSTVLVKSLDKNHQDLKFFLAILNSKLLTEIYKHIFYTLTLAGGYLRIGAPQIKKLPMIIPSSGGEKKEMVRLAGKMIKLNKELQKLDPIMDDKKYNEIKTETEKTDKEIDEKVYKLYGLTPEEIKIVEGETK